MPKSLFHGLRIVRNKLDSRQGMEDNLLLGTPTIQKDSSWNQHSHLHNLLLLEQRSYLHFQMGNIPWKSLSTLLRL